MGRVPPDDQLGKHQWRRITSTVKPLRPLPPEPRLAEVKPPPSPPRPLSRPVVTAPTVPVAVAIAAPRPRALSARTLDGRWDRLLMAGRVEPDMVVDLHGHRLVTAHAQLSRRVNQAVASGVRVLLVIAGKVRGPDEAPRGVIRRELEDWLAHGPHAARIAAVRNAHPRHGGAGAVYVIFRKPDPVR